MFADYQTLVVRYYQKKKNGNLLPLTLSRPTPAKLKEECLSVFEKRYDRKDDRTLRAFFPDFDGEKSGHKAIAGYENEKFKPLANFLEGRTITTEDKNIELLAWLIDFKPRPYQFGERYNVPDVPDNCEVPKPEIEVTVEVQESVPGTAEKEKPGPSVLVRGKVKRKGKKTIAVITILIVLGMVVYLARMGSSSAPKLSGHEACMYWAEDHYQPVSCSQRMENVQVIALDSEMVLHFRKITRPDTITDKAIGYVWYVRYRKDYEFYTADGFHPVDPTLRLRPITEYIIRNHIHPKP